MAIALVGPGLDPLGGQAVQADALVRHLRAEGCPVTFIPINPRFPARLQWLRRWPYARTVLNQALYLPSLLGLRQADVVHVFSASYWSFLLGPAPAMVVARLLGKRVILNYRSGEADDHLAHWGPLLHPWLRLAHEIVVPSLFLRDVFAGHGYHVTVIPNVVDTVRFAYRERAAPRPRLLSTRNLEPLYRVDVTLRAFALIKARYPDATLTLAGAGGEADNLRRLAASLGLEGVRFLGRVERAEMPALYADADFLVNSSVIDNQPGSVLEALAAGLAVVSTGTGDIAAMLRNGETGVLVPPGDPEAMANAIAALVDHPERAVRLTRAARNYLEQHRWPKVREGWAAAYSGAAR